VAASTSNAPTTKPRYRMVIASLSSDCFQA